MKTSLTKQEQKLGALLHHRDGPIQPLIDASGFSKNYCYTVLRRYREEQGLPLRDGRGRAPPPQLEFPEALEPANAVVDARPTRLQPFHTRVDSEEVRDLRLQLDRAHKEVETLQKIVMVLGDKL